MTIFKNIIILIHYGEKKTLNITRRFAVVVNTLVKTVISNVVCSFGLIVCPSYCLV